MRLIACCSISYLFFILDFCVNAQFPAAKIHFLFGFAKDFSVNTHFSAVKKRLGDCIYTTKDFVISAFYLNFASAFKNYYTF